MHAISFILVVEIGPPLTILGHFIAILLPITVCDEHHKQDILSGRGFVIQGHHGNQQLRSMVDAQRPKFVQIKKKKNKPLH